MGVTMDTNQTQTAAGAPEVPTDNPFRADAQAKVAALRAMAAEFPDVGDPRPLTAGEVTLAKKTSISFLEKSALFIEASPTLGGALSDAAAVREAASTELAYGGVIDEAAALIRRVQIFILRRKLKAAKVGRALYRVGKGLVTSDQGDGLRPHVEEMGKTLNRRRKPKRPAPAPPAQAAEKKA